MSNDLSTDTVTTRPSEPALALSVAIIGAGPAGLTAAYLLSRAGGDKAKQIKTLIGSFRYPRLGPGMMWEAAAREAAAALRYRHFLTVALVGRNGMHKYNNQDHAMMTAMLTVRNILDGNQVFDVWNVNQDAEYHEAGDRGAAESLEANGAASGLRQVPQRVSAG